MPYSSSLTDKEWAIIEPLLPQKKQTRPPKWTKRQILDGIFYQLKNGCNWCDLPCIFTAVSPLSGFCDAICFAATLRDRFGPLLIPTQSSN
ncbi:transposase [Nostoc sp. XA010]|uniref:transposase n=1 Tax=Nostoc sp. XA010 TaxID=2780407 RepID=UPI001E4011B7|nr:transposase [Nostoc sp. XA010]MCC5656244.1 transposase [Nostoc sp. XA010]